MPLFRLWNEQKNEYIYKYFLSYLNKEYIFLPQQRIYFPTWTNNLLWPFIELQIHIREWMFFFIYGSGNVLGVW